MYFRAEPGPAEMNLLVSDFFTESRWLQYIPEKAKGQGGDGPDAAPGTVPSKTSTRNLKTARFPRRTKLRETIGLGVSEIRGLQSGPAPSTAGLVDSSASSLERMISVMLASLSQPRVYFIPFKVNMRKHRPSWRARPLREHGYSVKKHPATL